MRVVTTTYPLVEWLRDELRERDWIEADLARALDIHSGMVSRWMQGVRPAPQSSRRIAEAFGVDPGFVLKLAGGVRESEEDPEKVELKAMIDGTDLKTGDRAATLRALLRSWTATDRRSASE